MNGEKYAHFDTLLLQIPCVEQETEKMNKKIKLSAPVLIWMVQISQHCHVWIKC